MLVLSRHRDESIMIGDEIVVTIVDIRGDKVRLGIDAPQDIPVHRQEVYEAIQRENRKASQVQPKETRDWANELSRQYLRAGSRRSGRLHFPLQGVGRSGQRSVASLRLSSPRSPWPVPVRSHRHPPVVSSRSAAARTTGRTSLILADEADSPRPPRTQLLAHPVAQTLLGRRL